MIQDKLDNGNWRCKLTRDSKEMRGENWEEVTPAELAEFNEYNTKTMATIVERGLWDLVPGFGGKANSSDFSLFRF